MAKKRTKKALEQMAPAPASARKSKYQAFEMKTIHRGQITNAPWNPRKITDEAKKKLKKNLKSHGLVTTICWNENTGHVVGGHKRLEILDELEGNQDYHLDVACIDVPEGKEAEINIALNNTAAMGEYDIDVLESLAQDFEINLNEIGFDDEDLEIMGIQEWHNVSDDVVEDLEAAREKLKRNSKQAKQSHYEGDGASVNSLGRDDYQITLVFDSEADCQEFRRLLKQPPRATHMHWNRMKDRTDINLGAGQ